MAVPSLPNRRDLSAGRLPRRARWTGTLSLANWRGVVALEQDWEMMQRQQRGLRNAGLGHMALTRQEVRLAYYPSVLAAWVGTQQQATERP
jgi:hypothetical protein